METRCVDQKSQEILLNLKSIKFGQVFKGQINDPTSSSEEWGYYGLLGNFLFLVDR